MTNFLKIRYWWVRPDIMLFAKLYSISILFLFLSNTVSAQGASAQGKNFWFGFLNNAGGQNDVYTTIASTSSSPITGTISMPGLSWSQNFTVPPNATIHITMPAGAQPGTSEGIYNNAVHIVSSDSIVVYAENITASTSDASFIFPVKGLGYKYIVNNWAESLSPASDEVSIVASENNTQIRITPSVATSGGHPAGIPYTITLNQGEAYLITKDLSDPDSVSLTGTKIAAVNDHNCMPFAVFGGQICTFVNNCYACDHLYEQLLPNSELGTNYTLPPLKEKDTTIYKIVAVEDGTNVIINNGPAIILNAGQAYIFKNNTASSVTANSKIMIMQFAQGYGCDQIGDPFQILMYNDDQMIRRATFRATVLETSSYPLDTTISYWVNIITKTSDIANTVLDGVNIAADFSQVPSKPAYSFARERISTGDHSLSNPDGFLAYVYAWGFANSYGFCAGAKLSNSSYPEIILTSNSPICAGDSLQLTASGGQTYQWWGPDGFSSNEQNPLITNSSVDNSGLYTLLVADSNGCDTTAQTNVTVHPKPSVEIQIESDTTTQLCMGDKIMLRGMGAEKYRWRSTSKLNDDAQTEVMAILEEGANIFLLTGFNQWNCSDTATILIKIKNCCQIFVPNAFTPNGDGLNDKFGVKTNGHPKLFLLKIFNRWGQLVFTGHSPEELWDGTFNNQHSDMDTYFYRLSGKCANGAPFEKSGSVNLVR